MKDRVLFRERLILPAMHCRAIKAGRFLFALLCSAVVATQVVNAATITVTSTSGRGPGSLRQAVATAQSGDTIDFGVTGTITLTGGPLNVPEFRVINIDGPGANALAINGNATTFLFNLGPGTVSISD